MQTTEMYFYEDVYARQLVARILEYGNDEKFGPFLVMSRTIFHAHGGGQKGDKGKVIFNEPPFESCPTEINIIDTRGEKGGTIKHIIARDLGELACENLPGVEVRLELDWAFRFTQMRLHSTSHLIHIFMERFVGSPLPPPRISDILEDYGLNVYETILNIKPDDMPKIVSTMNEFLAAGNQIATYPDPSNFVHRYWKCGDVIIPCGGTHPHNTSEIGQISANLSVKKGKTKVNFRLT